MTAYRVFVGEQAAFPVRGPASFKLTDIYDGTSNTLLFGERCREAGVEISIGCTSAHDNAVAESFFASLTKDLLRRRPLRSRAEARSAVFDYIETFYNRVRLHSTLDYLSPVDYEKMKQEEQQQAA